MKIAGKEIKAVALTIGNIKLQGRSDGATAELYYRGPASSLKVVAKSPYVKSIFIKAMPDIPPRDFFTEIRMLTEKGAGTPQPTLPVMRETIGASRVEQLFGVNGTGVIIAVVDTGVDYGHPDLQEALAWLIKTKDGREIIASSISPAGTALQYKTLRGQSASLPTSQVASLEPLALDADESQVLLLKPVTASSGYLPVSGQVFFVIDGAELYEVSATCNYAVTGLTSRSGVYKFGMTNLYIPWYGGYVNVGVVMYDPDQPRVYTAARVDINRNCNFADDPELRYFGNRLIVDNPTAPHRQPRRRRRLLLRLGPLVRRLRQVLPRLGPRRQLPQHILRLPQPRHRP